MFTSVRTTSEQALERIKFWERIHSVITVILRAYFTNVATIMKDEDPSVTWYQVPIALDFQGKPFRVHDAFDSNWPAPLLIPTIYIGMNTKPEDINILSRGVEVLRNGSADSDWWKEAFGVPPLSTPAGLKFSVEFGCEDWTVWIPPRRIDLPGKDGKFFEYTVGDESGLKRWVDNMKGQV